MLGRRGTWIVTLLLAASTAVLGAPVAMITDLQGGVRLFAASAPRGQGACPRMMQVLNIGDRLRAAKGGAATLVFFASGARERVQPASAVSVAAGQCKRLSGPAPHRLAPVATPAARRLRGMLAREPRSGAVLLRDEPGRLKLLPEALHDTSTLEARPTFRWSCEPGADRMVITVYDAQARAIWSGTPVGSSLVYPPSAPELVRGQRYLWSLSAEQAGMEVGRISGAFHVLAEAVANAVLPEVRCLQEQQATERDATPHVLLIALYAEHALWDDAISACEALVALRPADQQAGEQLGALLAAQGRLPADDQEK